ncbi:MAG: hypothetical protein AB8F78_06360 [Saprospiraceae bacterium]
MSLKQPIYQILVILLIGSCAATKPTVQSKTNNIKSISEALYNPQRHGNLSREDALKDVSNSTKYDTSGSIIKYQKFDKGSIYETTIYKRNEDGELLSSETYDISNNIKSKTKTTFNKNGKVRHYKTFDKKESLTSIQENEYDKSDNNISLSRKIINSGKTWITKKKYNSTNQLIEEVDFNPDGTIRDTRIFKYGASGNEIESVLTRPNGDYTKFVSQYDKNDNMTEQNWYKEDNTHYHKTSFEYLYDEKNNWITRKRYSNDELGMVWERKIEYY